MDKTTETTAPQTETAHEELRTRLDELRVRAHLAGMDARTEWEALRHELHHLLRGPRAAVANGLRALLLRVVKLEQSLDGKV